MKNRFLVQTLRMSVYENFFSIPFSIPSDRPQTKNFPKSNFPAFSLDSHVE